jgi:hypothetical protein
VRAGHGARFVGCDPTAEIAFVIIIESQPMGIKSVGLVRADILKLRVWACSKGRHS